ncbi:MAG: hypothetical protein SGPRY_006012 [Prymnesium sp.]
MWALSCALLLSVGPQRLPSCAPPRGIRGSSVCARDPSWTKLSLFEKMAFLRSLLDETGSREAVNRAVWLGLGLVNEESPLPTDLPDVFSDANLLARLEAELPDVEDEDGPEQLASLDMVVEVLHGTEMTRLLIKSQDPEFAVRRTVVRWLVNTQPELALG